MTEMAIDEGSDDDASRLDALSVPRVYNASLLLAFVANVFQLIAVSLLFRYSDFVNVLGGNEWHLGWIVGLSSVGAIVFRLVQGTAIDRFGPGSVWLVSVFGEMVALLWHLNIDSVTGFEVYAARTLFALSVAGTFGAWLSFISLQAPQERIAEVIGVVGSSGFVGMAIGPTLGDGLFSGTEIDRAAVNMMFGVAAAMTGVAWGAAMLAVRLARHHRALHEHRNEPKSGGHAWRRIWRNRPGLILLVGALMGLSIGFPGTFLRPLAESHGISHIKTFFIVYNLVAFTSRLLFRRAPQVLGLKPTILLGFGFMAASMLLYLPLRSVAGFWWPAAAGGMAHSFLFPSVVASCTNRFPIAQRGLATHLILAMYDLGVLVGMPMIGLIVTQSRAMGRDPYATAIEVLCGVIVVVSLAYLIRERETG